MCLGFLLLSLLFYKAYDSRATAPLVPYSSPVLGGRIGTAGFSISCSDIQSLMVLPFLFDLLEQCPWAGVYYRTVSFSCCLGRDYLHLLNPQIIRRSTLSSDVTAAHCAYIVPTLWMNICPFTIMLNFLFR